MIRRIFLVSASWKAVIAQTPVPRSTEPLTQGSEHIDRGPPVLGAAAQKDTPQPAVLVAGLLLVTPCSHNQEKTVQVTDELGLNVIAMPVACHVRRPRSRSSRRSYALAARVSVSATASSCDRPGRQHTIQ
jgi:hypothetical protein